MCSGEEAAREEAAIVFAGKGDPYNGVSVSAAAIDACASLEVFSSRLAASLLEWTSAGKKGIWLSVPTSRLELLVAAQALGFQVHHAERDYIMLNRWLAPGDSRLPTNASHSVGVGAVCVNDNNEILVVQEETGPAAGVNRGAGGFWKVPTGLVEQGEDISTAALRELVEETGVEAEFVAVAAVREAHRGLHGKSNMYFVCVCKPLTQELIPQAGEIARAQWMPVADFLELPYYSNGTAYSELNQAALDVAKTVRPGLDIAQLPIGFRPGTSTCYMPPRPSVPQVPTPAL